MNRKKFIIYLLELTLPEGAEELQKKMNIKSIKIDGDETLVDADILIVDPSEIPRIWKHAEPNNKLELQLRLDQGSQKIFDNLRSRVSEIETLLKRGKIVITLSSKEENVILLREYENRLHGTIKTHTVVSNYTYFSTILSNSSAMLKNGHGDQIKKTSHSKAFSDYYEAFSDKLFYEVFLIGAIAERTVFFINKAGFPVGFLEKREKGTTALLPRVKLNKQNVDQFFQTIIQGCEPFITQAYDTPPPDWLSKYILEGEKEIESQIENLKNEIKLLETKKEEKEQNKLKITHFKKLLYETGTILEEVTIKAFKLFGFEADKRKEDDLEHDVVFSSKEGRGVAEIEGKDKSAIHIKKLDQLSRIVDEDFEINADYPAGILIGNHYRLEELEQRKEPFTEKVQKAAKRKKFGLLTTCEIYRAVEYILKKPNDEEFKKRCRKAILKTAGQEIKFDIPKSPDEEKI